MNLWVKLSSSKVLLKASFTVEGHVLLLCGVATVPIGNAVSRTVVWNTVFVKQLHL